MGEGWEKGLQRGILGRRRGNKTIAITVAGIEIEEIRV
jgi:hypothetical protein